MFPPHLPCSPSGFLVLSSSRSSRFLLLAAALFAPVFLHAQTPRYAQYVEWFNASVAASTVPGVAMAVVSSDRVLEMQTWGVRAIDQTDPVDASTVFRIASVSKTFAGAVAATLVHERKQDWDTPLTRTLPQLVIGTEPSSRELTLRHVLSHSTGLMPHAFSNMLDAGVAYQKIQQQFTEIPTVCQPGRCYGYQNVVFSLVSDVVQVSEQIPYEQYVESRLFEPLGMNRASMTLEDYLADTNVSAPHQRRGEQWHTVSTNAAYYSVGPAAGVNASLNDMIIWAQANLGAHPEVLPPEVLAQQHAPVVETPRGNYFNRWPNLEHAWYGLGWRVFDYAGQRVVHHGGGVRGFRTELVLVPALDIGMIVLFNAETPLANDVVPHFLDALLVPELALQ
jgi:beta-lactamase class C